MLHCGSIAEGGLEYFTVFIWVDVVFWSVTLVQLLVLLWFVWIVTERQKGSHQCMKEASSLPPSSSPCLHEKADAPKLTASQPEAVQGAMANGSTTSSVEQLVENVCANISQSNDPQERQLQKQEDEDHLSSLKQSKQLVVTALKKYLMDVYYESQKPYLEHAKHLVKILRNHARRADTSSTSRIQRSYLLEIRLYNYRLEVFYRKAALKDNKVLSQENSTSVQETFQHSHEGDQEHGPVGAALPQTAEEKLAAPHAFISIRRDTDLQYIDLEAAAHKPKVVYRKHKKKPARQRIQGSLQRWWLALRK